MASPTIPELSDQDRKLVLLGVGVVGGAAIARAAFEHFFVRGLEPKERKKLVTVAAGAGLVYAAVTLLDIDKRWWDAEAAAEALEQYVSEQAGMR